MTFFILFYSLFYFFLHSLLASLYFKTWLQQHAPQIFIRYRLLYNLLASVLVLPLLYIYFFNDSASLWQWPASLAFIPWVASLIIAIAFIHASRDYDLRRFMGISDRAMNNTQDELFCIGRWHHYVRHPWYFLLLLLLWVQNMDTHRLLLSGMISLYLIVGSRLEEKKLVIQFGWRYRLYQQKVCGLIPLPWKVLSASDKQQLLLQREHHEI